MRMTTRNFEMDETARLWAIRAQDPSFDDWDGLSEWLEVEPSHLAAYETALDDANWAAELYSYRAPDEPAMPFLQTPEPAVAHRPRRSWFAIGGAIAAAIVGVATWSVLDRQPVSDIITAPGEHRTIALADGSRVVLNGGTRITMSPDTPREVALTDGEALFEVKHDIRDPFVVVVGGTRLVDAGTVFNVISEDGALDVAVAEGAVIYEPGRREIRLQAGDALSRASAQANPVLRKAAPEMVGSWQAGRLQYSNVPLDQVARDLGRNLGRDIRPAGGAERLRFTGTLVVDGSTEQVLARAGPLLGVTFAENGDAWTMTPAHGAPTY
jgi:transmembrane sensor